MPIYALVRSLLLAVQEPGVQPVFSPELQTNPFLHFFRLIQSYTLLLACKFRTKSKHDLALFL